MGRKRNLREVRVAAVVAVLGLLVLAAPAGAATFTVNSTADTDDTMCTTDPGGCTLREAIDGANGNGSTETDQITFGFTGAIGLSSQLPPITTRTTITGPGPTAADLLVYRQSGTQRIMMLDGATAGDPIRIERLTIDNGDAGTLSGGGVYVDAGGTNVLDGVVVKNSKAANGGGVFVGVGASLQVIRSTISGNTANDTTQATGAGIHNKGELFVDSSAITNNTNTNGHGGGVWSGEISLNSAVIVNSTIAGNKATTFGGGIHVSNGSLTLTSDTVARNTSNSDDMGNEPGGGVNITPSGADVGNTILAGNVRGTAAPVPDQCNLGASATLNSDGYNLRSSPDPVPAPPGACDPHFNKPGDTVNPATMLGPLAGNGGPTETIDLLPGSPAIDAGNPALPAGLGNPHCPADDQRGLPRGGATGRCDIGALEVQPAQPVQPVPPAGQAASSPLSPTMVAKKCKKGRKLRKGKCVKKKKRRKK